jgi:hypothetical protein
MPTWLEKPLLVDLHDRHLQFNLMMLAKLTDEQPDTHN